MSRTHGFAFVWTAFSVAFIASSAGAHDVWLQTNVATTRVGEVVHADLRLGNHGNHHRDFKLAGRVTLDWVTFEHVRPDGSQSDLKSRAYATASAEKEGYWSAAVVAEQEGIHCLVQSLDRVMNHGRPVRGIRTAKGYFLAGGESAITKGSERITDPLGLPFELVLRTCPFREIRLGAPIEIQVLHHGKPLAGVVVSFIPSGVELVGEFDPRYEFRTDSQGLVEFTPEAGNLYLVAAHYTAEDERGADHEFTSYASTLTLHVPVTGPWVTASSHKD